ncbi:MAG: Nif3-like dinuclear metal center hexameric protein [Bacilli bacterium]
MEAKKFLIRLGLKFPKAISEPWDFPGYQVGKKDNKKEIRKVFLCLDLTEKCLPEIKKFNPDIIITHHPFIFGSRKDVFENDPLKKEFADILDNLPYPVYSYHTDFDKGENGMNDTLLSLLPLEKTKVLEDGLMRIAYLKEETDIEGLAFFLKETWHLPYTFLSRGKKKKIRSFGLVAGGGADMFKECLSAQADCYVSGDCAHHTRVDIRRYGVNYIGISHEVEEYGFLLGMKNAVLSIDKNIKVHEYEFEKDFDIFY